MKTKNKAYSMNFLVRKDKIMDKKYKRFVRMYENYITEIEMYKEMIRELKKSLDKTRDLLENT